MCVPREADVSKLVLTKAISHLTLLFISNYKNFFFSVIFFCNKTKSHPVYNHAYRDICTAGAINDVI
jgi:hypothetical protein